MPTSRRRVLLSLIAVALLTAALGAVSAAASSPLKITNCFKAGTRPKLVILTCGDANTALSGLHWSSFGGAVAHAAGTFETNTCTPNCAGGKFVKYAVSIQASDPRTCKAGLRVYNKLTLKFNGPAPASSRAFQHWTLGCPIG